MELDELYQEIILDHYRHPRGRAELRDDEVGADEENPLCGDHLRLAVRVREGRVEDLRFDGKGCAISMASASILADWAVGRPVAEVLGGIEAFTAMMRGERPFEAGEAEDLNALAGVRQYPMRVKCATLAWHAAAKAVRAAVGTGGARA